MSKQAIITAVLILLISNYVSFQVGQTRLYYKQYSQRASQATAKDEPVYGVDQVLSFSPSKLDLDSMANNTPAIGALNAAATPAATPQPINKVLSL